MTSIDKQSTAALGFIFNYSHPDRLTAETFAESSTMPQFCRPAAKWRH